MNEDIVERLRDAAADLLLHKDTRNALLVSEAAILIEGHRNLATGVIIALDEKPMEFGDDTWELWKRVTGSEHCSTQVLCDLARKLLGGS